MSGFYEDFIRLCNGVGKSPSAVAVEIGLSKATVNRWKNGGHPTDATYAQIKAYFSAANKEQMAKKVPIKEKRMAREYLTDEQVEQEIARLKSSDYVKLAKAEARIRTRRRQYMYTLRWLENHGKELEAAGLSLDMLDEES